MVGISSYKTTSRTIGSGTPLRLSLSFGVGLSYYGILSFWVNEHEIFKESLSSYSYTDFIDKINSWSQSPIPAPLKNIVYSIANDAKDAYNLMVACAVLSAIGSVILILGIIFLIVNNKKLKAIKNADSNNNLNTNN